MKIHHVGIASTHLNTALESLVMAQSAIVEEVYDELQGNVLYFIRQTQQTPIIELVIPFRTRA